MYKALNYIDELKNQLQALAPIKQEYQQKLDKKFRLEFSYNSNHLEGNTLTYGETELLLIFGETKGVHDKREYDEMEAHDVAFERIKEWANDKERPLTEMAIKSLNELILVKPFWKDAVTGDGQPTKRQIKIGDYKEYPNSVRLPNGQLFDYASPTETPILMGELIEWYRSEEEKKELHPVALAALLHYRFVRIHPFDDGNGRISRLLVNYVLLKNDLPPVIIKSADKTNYLHALHQADAGFTDEFIDYIAEQVKWSLEISIKAAKGENIDETGDFKKEIELIRRKVIEISPIRSPILVYNAFQYLHSILWSSVLKTSTNIDSLFSENRVFHFANNFKEQFETKKVSYIDNLFMQRTESTAPKEKKIFGHEIYDEHDPIVSVKWEQIKYSLKGAKEQLNYKITLLCNFNLDNYLIELSVNINPRREKKVFTIQKYYGEQFLTDEIQQLNISLESHLLEEIKKDVIN